ncbi:MAG TPA: ATP-binding cassette domain-containing protein [Roseiflexaceae bacterium]|nr:ATP-binding cassette domain-containing protein [Roseiflexaceae bacterium]
MTTLTPSAQRPSATEPVLSLRDVGKRFGAVQALSDVSFDVYAGEVTALVGDNGAGKSTLIKCIAGIHAPDSGQIVFEGRPVHLRQPRDAMQLGIQTVYQDLALCNNLDVVANLFLGREEARRPGPAQPLDEVTMEQRALSVLRDLSVAIPSVRSPVASLSGGQRQSVAIARAVMWNSRLVMLDEPTAALGVAQTRQVLDLIKRLREQGLPVIVISHNLADVLEVADRLIVLRLGRLAGVFDARQTSQNDIVAAMTGATLGNRAVA